MTPSEDVIGRDEKRDALRRILADDVLSASTRQKEFLSYVVEESLAGRGDGIRGKTIAQDVYKRDHADHRDVENVVRVDARRLRQSLDAYYRSAGRQDPVRIWIDTGTYNPRFEPMVPPKREKQWDSFRKLLLPTSVFAAGFVIGGVLSALLLNQSGSVVEDAQARQVADGDAMLRRVAIYDKSPSALQARNLAESARGLMFPLFDFAQQELVTIVFERVIALDESYFGGYAGAAHGLASLSILSPSGETRQAYLEEATRLADAAIDLSPTEAMSQSARAWVAFAEGDIKTALRVSERAVEMDGKDGYVLDYRATIALFSGRFEDTIRIAGFPRDDLSNVRRFAHRNIVGAAEFHLGNYEESFASFEAAKRLGEPFSAASIAYQAAGLSALGRNDAARDRIDELRRAWPDIRVDLMLKRIHTDQAYAIEVVERLEAAGWEPSN